MRASFRTSECGCASPRFQGSESSGIEWETSCLSWRTEQSKLMWSGRHKERNTRTWRRRWSWRSKVSWGRSASTNVSSGEHFQKSIPHFYLFSPSLAIDVLFGVCGFFLWHLAGEDGKYETTREKVEAEKANKRRWFSFKKRQISDRCYAPVHTVTSL